MCSGNCKCLAFFDRYQERPFDCLFVEVLGQVKLVDAGVRLGKPVLVSRVDHRDLELLNAVLASETFEAFNRHFAAAGDKLDEFGPFTVVELS